MKSPLVPAVIIADLQEEAKRQHAQKFIREEMDRIRKILREKTRPPIQVGEKLTVTPQPTRPLTLEEMAHKDDILLSHLLYTDGYVQKFYIRYLKREAERQGWKDMYAGRDK